MRFGPGLARFAFIHVDLGWVLCGLDGAMWHGPFISTREPHRNSKTSSRKAANNQQSRINPHQQHSTSQTPPPPPRAHTTTTHHRHHTHGDGQCHIHTAESVASRRIQRKIAALHRYNFLGARRVDITITQHRGFQHAPPPAPPLRHGGPLSAFVLAADDLDPFCRDDVWHQPWGLRLGWSL